MNTPQWMIESLEKLKRDTDKKLKERLEQLDEEMKLKKRDRKQRERDGAHLPAQNKKCIFLHSEGHGGAGFRKGTDLVLNAFQQLSYTHKDVKLFINSQCSEQKHSQLHNRSIAGMVVNRANLAEPVDLFRAPEYIRLYSGSIEMFSGYIFGLSADRSHLVSVDEHSGAQVQFYLMSGSMANSNFSIRFEDK